MSDKMEIKIVPGSKSGGDNEKYTFQLIRDGSILVTEDKGKHDISKISGNRIADLNLICEQSNASYLELKNVGSEVYKILFPEWIRNAIKSFSGGALIFSCEGDPRSWPFEILHDGDDFLGRKFAISRKIILRSGSGSSNIKCHEYGDTGFQMITGPGLDHAEKEERAIKDIVENTIDWNSDQVANLRELTKCLENKDVVHFAGHIWSDKDGEKPGLQLGEDFIVAENEIQGIRLTAAPSLLFLNACSSAQIDTDLTGLAMAFIKANVKTFIGCSAPINDEYAKEMAIHFYEKLINDQLSYAEALTAARKEMKDTTMWGLYRLYGDTNAGLLPRSAAQLTQPDKLQDFAQYCSSQSRKYIDRVPWYKDTRNHYVERPESDVPVNRFLDAPERYSGLKWVMGEVGIGKTSLMCRAAESLLDRYPNTANSITLFIPLGFWERRERVFEYPLFEALREHYKPIANNCDSFGKLLEWWADFSKTQAKTPTTLCIIIDAIDEIRSFREAIKELDEWEKYLIHFRSRDRIDNTGDIRVAASVRQMNYELELDSLQGDGYRGPSGKKHKADADQIASIDRFSLNETENLYKTLTSLDWENLSQETKEIISNPLMLHFFTVLTRHREIEFFKSNLTEEDLYKEYTAYIFGQSENADNRILVMKERNFFLANIMRWCYEKEQMIITPEVGTAILNSDQKKSILKRKSEMAPVEMLVPVLERLTSNGLLVESAEGNYEFAHQSVGEYLLKKYIISTLPSYPAISLDVLDRLLEKLGRFEPVKNVFADLVHVLVVQNQFDTCETMGSFSTDVLEKGAATLLAFSMEADQYRSLVSAEYTGRAALKISRFLWQMGKSEYRSELCFNCFITLSKSKTLHERVGREKLIELLLEGISYCDELINSSWHDKTAGVSLNKSFFLGQLSDIYRQYGADDLAMQTRLMDLALCKEMLVADPNSQAFLTNIACTLSELSELHAKSENSEESIESGLEALRYTQLLTESDLDDGTLLSKVADCYSKLSELYRNFEEEKDALKSLLKCLEIRKVVVEKCPNWYLWPQEDLAHTYALLGNLYIDTYHPRNALKSFLECLNIRKKMARVWPDCQVFLYREALTCEYLSQLYARMDNHHKALDFQLQCGSIMKEVVEKDPEDPTYLKALAHHFSMLSYRYLYVDNYDEALQSQFGAVQNLEKAVAKEPDNEDSLRSLASAFGALSDSYGAGSYDSAIKFRMNQLEIKKRLVELAPDDYTCLSNLGMTLEFLSKLLRRANVLDKAIQYRFECVKIWKRVSRKFPEHRFITLAELGNSYSFLRDSWQEYGNSDKTLKYQFKYSYTIKKMELRESLM